MNPGKIIDSLDIHESPLRYGTDYKSRHGWEMHYKYREDGSFEAAVEMCTGVGACRKTLIGTMCPSYIATRDEVHSTRGAGECFAAGDDWAAGGKWGIERVGI